MNRTAATEVLKVAYERDPEELDPLDMIEYLRSALRVGLFHLGLDMAEPEFDDTTYPTHGEQVANPNNSEYLGGDLSLRAGW